jgi:hypothetical protein
MLRSNTSVEWQVRESVRAKMRLLVKRLLRKYKDPPDGQEAAVNRVLVQAIPRRFLTYGVCTPSGEEKGRKAFAFSVLFFIIR